MQLRATLLTFLFSTLGVTILASPARADVDATDEIRYAHTLDLAGQVGLSPSQGLYGLELQANLARAQAVAVGVAWVNDGLPFGYSVSYKLRAARPAWSLALAGTLSLEPHRKERWIESPEVDFGRVLSAGLAVEGEWRPGSYFVRLSLGGSAAIAWTNHTPDRNPIPWPVLALSVGRSFF